MGQKSILIIPSCSDLNRGDQALVWETAKVAQRCGFTGNIYFQTERNEPVRQSVDKGLIPLYPILEHPSRMFSSKKNIRYSVSLKLKWGIVAIFDLLWSLLLLNQITRPIVSIFFNNEKKTNLEIFKNVDAVFMKGGGLLQTYGGLSSTYSMYFWTFPILLANALKKPVYIMPNSFGPFEGPFVKKIARFALSKCKIVTSRETYSQKSVYQNLGLKINNYPDLAFFHDESEIKRERFLKEHTNLGSKKLVAITMRPYRFPNSTDPIKQYARFKNAMKSFISWLYDKGYMPVVVEHTLAVNEHENDWACIKDVVKDLPKHKYCIIRDDEYDSLDLKRIYSFCDYIVGTRFHSVIFSLANKVPAIAISYTGNKTTGIMHDIGLDAYVIDIGSVEFEKLQTMFESLVLNEDQVKNTIEAYLSNATILREKMMKEIING